MKNTINDPNVRSNIAYIAGGLVTLMNQRRRGVPLLLLGIASTIHHYRNHNATRYKIDIGMAYRVIITNCLFIFYTGITQQIIRGSIIIATGLIFFFAGRKHKSQNNSYYKIYHSIRHVLSAIGTTILLY